MCKCYEHTLACVSSHEIICLDFLLPKFWITQTSIGNYQTNYGNTDTDMYDVCGHVCVKYVGKRSSEGLTMQNLTRTSDIE